MRSFGELGFVVGAEHHPQNFLKELVRPRGNAQWPGITVLLRDADAAGRFPAVAALFQGLDDRIDLSERHSIDRVADFCARREGPRVGVQLAVGQQE